MNRLVVAVSLLLLSSGCGGSIDAPGRGAGQAQAAPPTLDALRQELASGRTTAQQLLHADRVGALRPTRAFRRLLRDHCPVGEVTLVPAGEPGGPLVIEGSVTDPEGRPVPGARVYVFQTDARGHYRPEDSADDRHPRLFGFVATDAGGRFRVRTVRPAPYAHAPGTPAHVHVQIHLEGWERAHGEGPPSLYFADDPRLTAEAREEVRSDWAVIAAPRVGSDGTTTVAYPFVLRRAAEGR